MVSALSRTNVAPPTLSALRELAARSPHEADAYLKQMEAGLRGAGRAAEADAVAQVLTDTVGSLVERIARQATRLADILPRASTDWGQVQTQRAQSLGYDITPAKTPGATFLRGTVKADATGNAVLTTNDGRDVRLVASERALPKAATLQLSLMSGLVGDGELVLQGTVGADQTSFCVEGFALDTDGTFQTFTFGRVLTDGSSSVVTPRGEVAIADPTLSKKLLALPGLAVILPGEPETGDEGLVYRGTPAEFFALARWSETHREATGPTISVKADMAYSVFDDQPVEMPAKFAPRCDHLGRVWLRGDVTLDRRGNATKFDASYVSVNADSAAVKVPPAGA